jgi:hypothetical protein
MLTLDRRGFLVPGGSRVDLTAILVFQLLVVPFAISKFSGCQAKIA